MTTATQGRATNVVVYADVDINRDGDEFQVWHVGLADDDGEPVGKWYTYHNYAGALELGQKMARERRLELNIER